MKGGGVMQPTQNQVTDDSAVTPASTLRAAGGYLLHYGWHQDDMFDNPELPTPAACALGAIRMAIIGTPTVAAEHVRPEVLTAFDAAVHVFAGYLIGYGFDTVYEPDEALEPADLEQTVIRWNDDQGRIASHVIAALNGAADDWDRTHAGPGNHGVPQPAAVHVDYPHQPGTLYDCPVCETVCFCDNGFQCVHCVLAADAAEVAAMFGGGA
jgi:hypothetical protein